MPHRKGPLVTAVVPVYNHEKYVVESIQSIINQSYPNIELIVINDGSKDNSHEMILTLLDECKRRFVRFEYINRDNIGLSATLNQALALSTGTYMSALASDDIALPNKIQILIDALEREDETCAAAFGDALVIDEEGNEMAENSNRSFITKSDTVPRVTFLEFYTRDRTIDFRSNEFGSYQSLLLGNYLPAMSNLVRTRMLIEAGGWTKGNVIEDWEMWLKLSKRYRFIYINSPVACYRRHKFNTENSNEGLTYASLLLLDNEKDFCSNNNFYPTWRRAHNKLLGDLICNKKIPFRRRLSLVKPYGFLNILQISLQLTVDKIVRIFGEI